MAKVFIEESTLTDIGDAIRAKTGDTALLSPASMVDAIAGITTGGGDLPQEALVYSGECRYAFASGHYDWLINQYGERITVTDATDISAMFSRSNVTEIPFDINTSNSPNGNGGDKLFEGCSYLTKLPYIKGKVGYFADALYACKALKEIPDDWADYIDWSYIQHSYGDLRRMFSYCFSLRKIPKSLMANLHIAKNSDTASTIFNAGFDYCYALDEINGLPIKVSHVYKSNYFNTTVRNCSRLKDFTFATQEDGAPYVVSWTNQTIDLLMVGYAALESHITGNNSGITEDTLIFDDISYQELKNHPDSWTANLRYSRYDKNSAWRTIQSLPDASEYVTAYGGTNTIKFRGAMGEKTDAGAISGLTEEQISVAAAKGWTVTLV